jgi:hypothetical protein
MEHRQSASRNHWTPEMETVARHIKNQSTGYTWIYEKIVSKAQKFENVLSILAGILSALIGTGGLVSVFEYDSGWIGITIAVVGFISAICNILNATWNFGVIKAQGVQAQSDFSNLSRSITYQLALHPSERNDAKEFVNMVLKEIDKLVLNAPSIDGSVKGEYTKKFKNNPIYNPEGQNVTISQESYVYNPNYADSPEVSQIHIQRELNQYYKESPIGLTRKRIDSQHSDSSIIVDIHGYRISGASSDRPSRIEGGDPHIHPESIYSPDTQDHSELDDIIAAWELQRTPHTTPNIVEPSTRKKFLKSEPLTQS